MSGLADQLNELKGTNTWSRFPDLDMKKYLLAETHKQLQEKIKDTGTLQLKSNEITIYSENEFPNELTFDGDLGALQDGGYEIVSKPKDITVYHRRSGLAKYIDRWLEQEVVISLKELDKEEHEVGETPTHVQLSFNPYYVKKESEEPEEEPVKKPVRETIDNMAKKLGIKTKIGKINLLTVLKK